MNWYNASWGGCASPRWSPMGGTHGMSGMGLGGFGWPPAFGRRMAHSMMGMSCGRPGGGWHGAWGGGWNGRPSHGCHGPGRPGAHEHGHGSTAGRWDSAKGGYVVGANGRIDVGIQGADADFNNRIQYRVGSGDWQDAGYSKDAGASTSIQARPGSTVQFRIQTPQGNTFTAGTSNNTDGMDHGKVSSIANGVQLGFEDYANDHSFDDAILNITDGRRGR